MTTAPTIHGPHSAVNCLTCSSCSSSVKYSSGMISPLPLSPFQTEQRPQAFTDLGYGVFLLRLILAQGLHCHYPAGHFVVPQNECKLRAALVGTLELRL